MGQESSSIWKDAGGASTINLFWPHIPKMGWLDALGQLFEDRWIGQGPAVDEFERRFRHHFEYPNALAVNSGTAALELAYELVGIGPGDLVLTPVLTCTATNIPLLRRGATIEFVDIDRGTLTMDLVDFRRKIGPDVKAVVVTTLGGMHVNVGIGNEARKWNVPVIVDCAQSLGIRQSWGDYLCYSFQAIKHFTTGDGGMLVCLSNGDHERAKRLRWFGIDRDKKRLADWQTWTDRHMTIDITEPGYKMHMNDVAATMGMVGLFRSDQLLSYRSWLANRYHYNLRDVVKTVWGGSCWLFAIMVESEDGGARTRLAQALKAEGVETDMVHLRNDIFSVFGGQRWPGLAGMGYVEPRYLYLPLHQNLSETDVKKVCRCVLKFSAR